jgi:hypothetical protein
VNPITDGEIRAAFFVTRGIVFPPLPAPLFALLVAESFTLRDLAQVISSYRN